MLLITGDVFSETYFVASFIGGLNEELQSSVSMFEPTTLQNAIKLRRKQDQATSSLTKKFKPYYRVSNPNPNPNFNPNSNPNPGRKENLMVVMVLRLFLKTQKHHLRSSHP